MSRESDALVQSLRQEIHVYTRGRSRLARPGSRDEKLLALYAARYRRVDPLWSPKPSDLKRAFKARFLLTQNQVWERYWKAYVRWLFNTAAEKGWVPPSIYLFSSEKMVKWFEETLHPRHLDVAHLGQLLARAGITGLDAYEISTVGLQLEVSYEQASPVVDDLNPRIRDAVACLYPLHAKMKYS